MMAKSIISSKDKYVFINKQKLAQTYCTPKEFQLVHSVTTRELNKLFKGDITITSNGWTLTS